MLALKRGEQGPEPVVTGVALRAHPDHPLGIVGETPDVFFGALDVADHAAGGVEEASARGGQHQAAAQAHEERGVELRFDVPELVAQCRLRQEEPFGRLGHAPGVGDLEHQAQVADFQVHAGRLTHEPCSWLRGIQ
jgi:hypothetical protein